MKILIIFISIFFPALCMGQWKEVQIERDIFNKNSVSLISYQNEDTIICADNQSNTQNICFSFDGGNNFKYAFNLSWDVWGQVQNIRFIDKDTLVIITALGIIKKSTDIFHTPEFLIKFSDYDTAPITFLAPSYFYKGDSGIVASKRIFKTYDGGRTWVNEPKSLNNGWGGIGFTYIPESGRFLNTNSSYLFESKNYGNTWDTTFNFVPLIKDKFFGRVNDFSFIDDKIGYTILGRTIYKTTDGGSSWDSVGNFVWYGFGQSIKFFDENVGYALFSQHKGLQKTVDGGETWVEEFEFPTEFSSVKEFFYFGDSAFFVVNGKKLYKRDKASLGIELPKVKTTLELLMYPNPTTSYITVKILGGNKNNSNILSIYDLQGRLLYEESFYGQEKIIKLEELEKGLYLVQVRNGLHTFTQRLIKQ